MRKKVLLSLAILFQPNLWATENVTLIDPDVEVEGHAIDPAAQRNAYSGSNATMADTALASTLQTATLADFLSRHSPVFVKESGKGMMSIVSVRGTAASQTAVSWDGIPINSLTMGQTDFNTIPLFFLDQAEIAPGGESSLYGSGAIGGSIDLRNSEPPKGRFSGLALQSAGSYGQLFSGLKLQGTNKKMWTKTSAFFNRAENDFHFNLKDFGGERTQAQHNADYYGYGIQQLLGWHIDPRQHLVLKLWHTNYDRNIQPSAQNNNDPNKYENIADRNTRVVLDYTRQGWAKLNGKLAYLNDHEKYRNDLIATHNILTKADAEHQWQTMGPIRQARAKIGGQLQYVKPEVYAYDDGNNEWRNEIFASAFAQLGRRWRLNAGIRQQWVSGEDAPFSPSAGVKFHIVDHDSTLLKLKANLAHNYRIPTLNDRYWGHLDNRHLKAEDATNYEGGAEAELTRSNLFLHLSATAFHNNVENWILWMPRGNVWKPINVDLVEVNGAELTLRATCKKQTLQAAYTHSHTEVVEGFAEMRPFKGRQIALLPEDCLTASFTGRWKSWKLVLATNYTGQRNTSDVFDTMDAYWLCNTSLTHTWKLGEHTHLQAQAQVNNLFDTNYQTVPYKAMPGRNYLFEVKVLF